jgi:hypothetical protein
MAAGAGIPRVLRDVATAPILLASLHGVYSEGSDFFTVAPNTIIIETVEPGEYCMSSVDPMSWDLAQGFYRTKLFTYLMGGADPTDTPENQTKYKDFAQHLTVYTPGSRIYNRHLKIGPTNDTFHNRMGFFKFDVTSGYLYGFRPDIDGTTHPAVVFKDLRAALASSLSVETTYSDLIARFDAAYGADTPRIFMIVSCGSTDITLPSKEKREFMRQLEQTAAVARLEWKKYQADPANAMFGLNMSTYSSPRSLSSNGSDVEYMHPSASAPHTSKVYQSQSANVSFTQSQNQSNVNNTARAAPDVYEVMVRKKTGDIVSAIGFSATGAPRVEQSRKEMLEMLIRHADSGSFDQIVRVYSTKDLTKHGGGIYTRDMIYLIRTRVGVEDPAEFVVFIDAKDRMKALRTELRELYRAGYTPDELEIHHTRKEYHKEDDEWKPLKSYLVAMGSGGGRSLSRGRVRGRGRRTRKNRRRYGRRGVTHRK